MAAQLPLAIMLMGPTATGKTNLALQLCDLLPCDIISVDSVMVYKDMDIGSAKPDRLTLQQYPHYLVDINDPAETYSAAAFRQDALAIMHRVAAQQRIPLLVGGTMLYFNMLVQGIADMPGANLRLREKMMVDAKRRGWPALHSDLAAIDPLAASKIHPNNRQRIQRALEVCLTTGQRFSDYWRQRGQNSGKQMLFQAANDLPYEIISLAITPPDRERLANRISKRFNAMLEKGLVEEVERLFNRRDLNPDLPSIRAVGYRQVWQYVAGDINRSEMIAKAEAATRQLAKRQMTWLKTWPDLRWLEQGNGQLAQQVQFMLADRLH